MIKIFYGPSSEFKKILPDGIRPKTLTKLISELDAKMKTHNIVYDKKEEKKSRRTKIKTLVVATEEYSRLTDSGINTFLKILEQFDISDIYLQNPPNTIIEQLQGTHKKIEIQEHEYKKISEGIVKAFYNDFEKIILGQTNSKNRLVTNLYKLSHSYNKDKPIVLLFYGPTGVGKTETAKYIASLMGESIFRKQFSMYQNNSFSDYVFGESHTASSLARDLLERKSNVILFDEFDKTANIFYSAFYQMFDEGIFVDKNYTVNLKNSIIICTSNFNDLNDIRKTLGEPIYNRFNDFIQYNELSKDIVEKLISIKFLKIYEDLNENDKKNLEDYKDELLNITLNTSSSIKNVREIDRIIDEVIFYKLINLKFNDNKEKS